MSRFKYLHFLILICCVFLPATVYADEASTTEAVVPQEISTTTETESVDIDLNSVATTTEDGETYFIEEPEPTMDASQVVDESIDEQAVDETPVDEVPVGTYISGSLTESQTWNKENGPYYISDIYIPNGVTITVEAGTQIFASGYVAVFGNFTLNGAKSDKIVVDLDPDFSSWYLYADAFANLNFTGASINHADGIFTNNGFINFTDVDYLDATDGIVLSHFGSFVGEDVNFQGGNNGVGILAVDNSTIRLRDSIVDNGIGENAYIIQGYGGSKIDISNSKILTAFSVPVIIAGGQLDLDTVSISGGDSNGLELYTDSSSGVPVSAKVTIANTTISNFLGAGIFAISPSVTVAGSKILNNNNGIEFYVQGATNLSVTNSTVVGNITGIVFGVQNENANINIDVRNNWWGDESGPFMSGRNNDGFGDEIVGYSDFAKNKIQFEPWLLKEPNKRNPVIIIPGIMGSYLNRNDQSKTPIWIHKKKIIDPWDGFLDDLLLDDEGKINIADFTILPTDIFRSEGDSDFFAGLITKLKSNGYEEGKDLFVFPYDWRLDIADNVNGVENSQVKSLKDEISEILKDTKSDKVDIVAHSMGGLLAKYYIKHIGGGKVDKFVDVGTPHLGAPKASKILEYGDDLGILKFGFPLINEEEVKKISQNFPSTYNLLPSSKYFDSTLPDYSYYLYDLGDVDGDGVTGRLSYENTKVFLKNTGRNDLLIQNAELVHNDLDDFNPSDYGISSYNIVGCGTPTIGKIFANKKQFDGDYKYQIKYITGDGTVPERSAEGMSTDKLYYATGVEHATMPSQSGIRNLVASILKDGGEDFNYDTNSNIHTDTSDCKIPDGKIISIHSPVSLDIYDDSGHHTGPDENGDIEYGIDGVTYDTLDGNKFAFIPDTVHYTIKFNATGIGSAGVDVQDYHSGEIVKSESFENIPIESLNTKGEMVINEGGSKILLNRNGNGQGETLSPTKSAEGDFTEEPASANKSVTVTNYVSVASGNQIATASLNIQTFKYLNKDQENNTSILEQKIEKKSGDMPVVASTTEPDEVKLENGGNSQLASPAEFFGHIVSVVWNFLLELFNKIISYFK